MVCHEQPKDKPRGLFPRADHVGQSHLCRFRHLYEFYPQLLISLFLHVRHVCVCVPYSWLLLRNNDDVIWSHQLVYFVA